jgi:EmrB/QacA subfamily drug resistance transporter
MRARSPWLALGMLCLAEFMLVLDDTVVNIALPSIQEDLGFSQTDLAWVANAYMLAFGGFLLLGGRAADLFGRKRTFLLGIALFGVASVTNGAAQSQEMLIASRAGQGLGAALVSPAALSLVTTMFSDPSDREKALGVWTGLAALGAALGVVLSGAITDLISWRWIFYINIPVVLVAIAGIVRLVDETERVGDGGFDFVGAAAITGSLVAFVNALLGVPTHGWGSTRTLLGIGVAAFLFAAFVVREARTSRPLVRLGFFRERRIAVANGLQLGANAIIFAFFFMLTLYMQQVLRYSPLESGLSWLAFCGGLGMGFGVGSKLIERFGVRPVLVIGQLITAAGVLTFVRLPEDGSYWTDLLPGMVVAAVGLAWTFLPITIAAVADADEREAGLASGVLNAGQQIGSAVGLSVFVAVATERAGDLVASGQSAASAQVAGTQLALGVAGGVAVVGAVVAAALIGRLVPEEVPEATRSASQPWIPAITPESVSPRR